MFGLKIFDTLVLKSHVYAIFAERQNTCRTLFDQDIDDLSPEEIRDTAIKACLLKVLKS